MPTREEIQLAGWEVKHPNHTEGGIIILSRVGDLGEERLLFYSDTLTLGPQYRFSKTGEILLAGFAPYYDPDA
ncbi:MAG: hypothetical protein WC796_05375 [Candidatus Pacearchaeota archaeon]|jgi:hypothetical protein